MDAPSRPTEQRPLAGDAAFRRGELRNDALVRFTRKRAAELENTLKSGKPRDVEALVRKLQGYPPPR